MTGRLSWHGVHGTLYSTRQAHAQPQTVPQLHSACSRNNWCFASPALKFQFTKVWFWLEFAVSLFLKWDINVQQLPHMKNVTLPQSGGKGKGKGKAEQGCSPPKSQWHSPTPKPSSCRNYHFYHHVTHALAFQDLVLLHLSACTSETKNN